MKRGFLAGLAIAVAFFCGALPAAKGAASDGRQENPHEEMSQIRARRHLLTADVRSLSGFEGDPKSTNSGFSIPRELSPFVLQGEIPVYLETADLEQSGRLGYVLIVATQQSGDRTMKILSRSASGALSVVLSRRDAIQCDGCGGMDGDTSIAVGRGAIELHQVSGSAGGGTEVTCLFRYSNASHQWLLVDRMYFDWNMTAFEGQSPSPLQHETTKDFGIVSLDGGGFVDHCQ